MNLKESLPGRHARCGGQVGFPRASTADQNQVVRAIHETGAAELFDLHLGQRGFRPVKGTQVAVNGEACGLHNPG